MFSLRFIRKYLWHQLKSSDAHDLHSPYLFKFYTTILKGKEIVPVTMAWEAIRAALKQNHKGLKIVDMGAGSKFQKSDIRQISDIARNALKPPKLARFLYRLASDQRPSVVIELGTSLGISSLYLASAIPDGIVYTIEGSEAVAAVAGEVHLQSGLKNIRLITGNFDERLPALLGNLENDKFILYIDGNHQKEATLRYFYWSLDRAGENTMLIFDDIHWSEGMEEAWEIIKLHPRVTLSIDIFFMGIIFFKNVHNKQHFMLRTC